MFFVHLIENFDVTSTFTISANNWPSGQKVKPYVRNFQPKLAVEKLAVHMTKGWFYLSIKVYITQQPYL
jgi:O-phosphoseryl-tRNA(Cys) synthetase